MEVVVVVVVAVVDFIVNALQANLVLVVFWLEIVVMKTFCSIGSFAISQYRVLRLFFVCTSPAVVVVGRRTKHCMSIIKKHCIIIQKAGI